MLINKKTLLKSSALLFLAFTTFYSTLSLAGLVLNPQRIVFQDRERSASLDLLNTSEDAGRYQIFFENKIMKEDGSIVDIEDPEQGGPYSGDMIRYSPRRVDIPAGGSQTIRLALRRPKDLPEGEYLSHLVLKQIPNKIVRKNENGDSAGDDQLTLTVQPVLKLAIPVIVRKGTSTTSADISDIKPIYQTIKDESGNETQTNLVDAVHFTLERQGNFSLYGDVELFDLSQGEPAQRIGFIRGIALYDPTPQRLVRLKFSDALDLKGKELLLKYTENEKYGGTNKVEKTVFFD